MSTRDVQGWKATDWQSKVKYAKPSGGGAVGVAFVFTQAGANAATPASQAAFVIKPMQGSGATTKFAEHVLGKIAKVQSPGSKPILSKSPEGAALLNTLKIIRSQENDADVKARWENVMRHYTAADHFLIQEVQVGIREFGDVYRTESGLNKLLQDEKLMTNIGKLFAADAFIGNGDRLFSPNMGNIVFKPNGTLCAIDSSTILTSFNSIVNDVEQETRDTFGGAFGADRTEWGTNVVGKTGGLAVPSASQQAGLAEGHAPVLPPSFGMGVLFDVDDWWDNTFKSHLESGLRALNPPQPSPKTMVWAAAKMAFKSGVEQGLKQVDSKLSGLNWLAMKSKYNSYVKKYGGDANLDWTNFKVRRLYFKLRKKLKSDELAIAGVREYINKKLPG